MSQALIMFPQVTDADYIHRFKEDGSLRVSVNTVRGTFAAFGVSYSTERLSMGSLPSCPPNLPPCDPYELINTLGSKVSIARPQSFNTFVFLALRPGSRRTWAEEVRRIEESLGSDSGVFLAAAHLFGRGRYDAVVELLADDEQTFFDVLLRVTDLEYVVTADPHFLTAESQRGMGDEDRDVAGASDTSPG